MMIVSLTSPWASSFHVERGYPASWEMVKSFNPDSGLKNADRRDDCHGGLLFPPERGEHGLPFELRKRKILSTGSPSLSIRRHSQVGCSGACYRFPHRFLTRTPCCLGEKL
jgi:hypothetical protein